MSMKKLWVAAVLLPLSGCISFGGKPPSSLLTLTPAATVPVGETQRDARTITLMVPTVPQEIASARVPVHSGDTAIAYVKEAAWVEAPNRLFARLMAETIAARTGRVVLSTRQSLADPGASLAGELRRFGVEASSSEAVVTFDGTIRREGASGFERRRFEARVPLAAIEAAAVGVALNQAANQVATQVSDWVDR
jgi:cholesterol transport system auxiliary component